MRSIFILVALAACTTAIPLLSSPTNDDASSPLLSNKETGLTTRGDTSVGMYDHELHQRWLTLFLLAVSTWNTIPSGVALFFGMYSLGRSVYSIYDDCHQPQGTKDKVDCLLSCLDLVFAAFMGGWKLRSGLVRSMIPFSYLPLAPSDMGYISIEQYHPRHQQPPHPRRLQ